MLYSKQNGTVQHPWTKMFNCDASSRPFIEAGFLDHDVRKNRWRQRLKIFLEGCYPMELQGIVNCSSRYWKLFLCRKCQKNITECAIYAFFLTAWSLVYVQVLKRNILPPKLAAEYQAFSAGNVDWFWCEMWWQVEIIRRHRIFTQYHTVCNSFVNNLYHI